MVSSGPSALNCGWGPYSCPALFRQQPAEGSKAGHTSTGWQTSAMKTNRKRSKSASWTRSTPLRCCRWSLFWLRLSMPNGNEDKEMRLLQAPGLAASAGPACCLYAAAGGVLQVTQPNAQGMRREACGTPTVSWPCCACGDGCFDIVRRALRMVLLQVGPPKPPSPVPEGNEEEPSPNRDAGRGEPQVLPGHNTSAGEPGSRWGAAHWSRRIGHQHVTSHPSGSEGRSEPYVLPLGTNSHAGKDLHMVPEWHLISLWQCKNIAQPMPCPVAPDGQAEHDPHARH